MVLVVTSCPNALQLARTAPVCARRREGSRPQDAGNSNDKKNNRSEISQPGSQTMVGSPQQGIRWAAGAFRESSVETTWRRTTDNFSMRDRDHRFFSNGPLGREGSARIGPTLFDVSPPIWENARTRAQDRYRSVAARQIRRERGRARSSPDLSSSGAKTDGQENTGPKLIDQKTSGKDWHQRCILVAEVDVCVFWPIVSFCSVLRRLPREQKSKNRLRETDREGLVPRTKLTLPNDLRKFCGYATTGERASLVAWSMEWFPRQLEMRFCWRSEMLFV